jgi:A/G-specific adenine glycosylase
LKKLIIKGMGTRYFSDKLVKWYLDNKRSLPWRETADPYKVWLSEVILQQTRVIQGLPYYQQFVETYPTVQDLAHAPEQDILRLWQGLGYYTRARNLHKCAKSIIGQHNGKFPENYEELQKLPGIGPYTAAAVASFCFNEPVAVVDGNVFRILSRIFGIETPINSPKGKNTFTTLANELMSKTHAALHNQAVMEFGALFCTPRSPNCQECPFKQTCVAYNRDLINVLPAKTRAKKSRKRYFFYLVVEKDQTLLMKRRNEKDIWHGLFDFVLIEKNKPLRPERLMTDAAYAKWFEKMEHVAVSKNYKHILTHQTIHCRFIHLRTKASLPVVQEGLSFYSQEQIANLPKPALISRFLEEQNQY